MNAANLTAQDCVTLLLGLELLRKFAEDERQEACREKNVLKQASMQAMLDHVAALRVKLAGGAS